ncbi:unnamed protein product [Calicophoron daubneyi]|uniref:CAF1B/HIR1 beta-propeller domain-containing protein n=1 Tax=Calicophoron daubneyi TaxID=300641 RepID=A0AAV2TP60_CALDB
MRLLTPEIAWHETLPIYSCDLQNHTVSLLNAPSVGSALKPVRNPFADITSETTGSSSDIRCKTVDAGWTRLATAGGDNVVRLWRVRLSSMGSCSSLKMAERQRASTTAKKGTNTLVSDGVHSNLSEQLTYLASLKRHEKPVNVVRWSPSGEYLASAGDDLFIIIWTNQSPLANLFATSEGLRADYSSHNKSEEDDEEVTAPTERWIPCRNLRRHLEDIYDLSWSPDTKALISGSVDHSIIVWQLDLAPAIQNATDAMVNNPNSPVKEVQKSFSAVDATGNDDMGPNGIIAPADVPITTASGSNVTKSLIIRDHKHYVQGVTWDPLGFYVASLSSDRACRVYRAGTRNCLAHVSKAGKQRLFQDDSWKSFFRRLAFSPDGLLLICPAGNLEEAAFAGGVPGATPLVSQAAISTHNNNGSVLNSDAATPSSSATIPLVAPQHAAHIFLRTNFSRPVVSLPTGPRPVVTVRFCPQRFQLRPFNSMSQAAGKTAHSDSLFDLPYRWLFCLVLEDGILFYDTQQTTPFAQVSQCHYQALNDATWSEDGHLVVACSTDGYCSLIYFARGELGTPYLDPGSSKSQTGGDETGQRTQKECLAAVTEPEPTAPGTAEAPAVQLAESDIVVHPKSSNNEQMANAVASRTENTQSLCENKSQEGSSSLSNECSTSAHKRRVSFKTLSVVVDSDERSYTKRESDINITVPKPNNTSGNHVQKTPKPTPSQPGVVPKRRVSFVTISQDPCSLASELPNKVSLAEEVGDSSGGK